MAVFQPFFEPFPYNIQFIPLSTGQLQNYFKVFTWKTEPLFQVEFSEILAIITEKLH